MAAASNNIQISISVVDAGSSATIQKVRTEMVGLDTEAKSLAQSWGLAGSSIDRTNQRLRETSGAAGAAGAGLDRVKNKAGLLRYEFSEMGVRVPKYLAGILSGFQPLFGAISALSGAFVAMGTVSMFGMAIKEARTFYDEHMNINKSMDEYLEKAAKAAQQKLFDTASVETTAMLLKQVNSEIDELTARKQRASDAQTVAGAIDFTGWGGASRTGNVSFSTEDAKKLASDQALHDALANHGWEQDYEQKQRANQAQAEYNNTVLQGYAKINAARDTAIAKAGIELKKAQDYEKHQQDVAQKYRDWQIQNGETDPKKLMAVYKADPHAGEKEHADAVAAAQKQAQAEAIVLRRQNLEQEISLRNEAINAGLRGEALFAAQRQQQEDAIQRKIQQGILTRAQGLREISYIEEKYHNELMKRLEEEDRATARMRRDAEQSGLTGIAKIEAEGRNQQQTLIEQASDRRDFSHLPQNLSIAAGQTRDEIERAEQEYYQHMTELRDEYVSGELQGYARIEAEAKRHTDTLQREFEKTWGGIGQQDPRRIQAQAQLDQDKGAVGQAAERQRNRLAQQNADEILKIQMDSARRALPPEQQKTQQVIDEYRLQTLAFQRERDQQFDYARLTAAEKLQIEQTYNAKVLAAQQDMNARLIEQQRQTRDKLAGEMQGLFRSPGQWAQGLGEKVASQMAAEMVMKSGAGKTVEAALDPQHIADSITGVFHPRPHGTPPFIAKGQAPQAGGHGSAAETRNAKLEIPGITAGSKSTMQIASAIIQVGRASIVGGAGSIVPMAGIPSVGGLSAATTSPEIGTAGAVGGSSSTLGASSMGGGYTPAAGTAGVGGGISSDISSGLDGTRQGTGILKDMGIKIPGLSKLPGLGGGTEESGEAGGAGTQGGLKGALGGMVGGGMALFGAYRSNGGFGGAMQGAMGGAMMGAKLGGMAGPMGAAIGAAAGAIAGGVMGAFGFGGRGKAAQYDHTEVRPRITQDLSDFGHGSSDYLTAYGDLDNLLNEAKRQCKQFGPGGEGYFGDTIRPEIQTAQQTVTREAKAGRQTFGFSATMFDVGGVAVDFGDLATSMTHGFAHLQRGERVLTPQQNVSFERLVDRATSLPAATPQRLSVQSSAGDTNLHFYSHDPRGTYRLFMENKHAIRAALNESYAEYSGDSSLA